MKIIRWILGRLILLFDALTPPRRVQRPAHLQAAIDEQTTTLALYQYVACPFCVKVRRSMKRQNLTIETRDVNRNPQYRVELEQGGGRVKVPCLKILDDNGQASWLYESSDIVSYLEQRFAA